MYVKMSVVSLLCLYLVLLVWSEIVSNVVGFFWRMDLACCGSCIFYFYCTTLEQTKLSKSHELANTFTTGKSKMATQSTSRNQNKHLNSRYLRFLCIFASTAGSHKTIFSFEFGKVVFYCLVAQKSNRTVLGRVTGRHFSILERK